MKNDIFSKGSKVSAVIYKGKDLTEATKLKEFTEKLIAEKRTIGGDPREQPPVALSILPTKVEILRCDELDFGGTWWYTVTMEGIVQ